MTPRSRLINKLLKQGMESIAIAELLEASPSAVGGMIQRWGLPRD
jgi:predicted transcriptional regulator